MQVDIQKLALYCLLEKRGQHVDGYGLLGAGRGIAYDHLIFKCLLVTHDDDVRGREVLCVCELVGEFILMQTLIEGDMRLAKYFNHAQAAQFCFKTNVDEIQKWFTVGW